MRTTFLTLIMLATALAESAGGIKWTAPKNWKAQAERPMRAATYSVPAAAGDTEDGECAAFYFGAGQGGGVQANIDRWIGQFQNPSKPEIRKQTLNGVPVTIIDLTGTYLASASPMATTKTPKHGFRLLGAIAEGSEGAVFFKFTGPAKTVAAGQAAFDAMLKSVSR